MADVCVLCVNGLPEVPLKPNEIYRIGKQAGLEIFIANESMELAHGIVSLLRSGIVRIAAVAGRIFVNEEEKQISDIRKEDAKDGKVRLRFGNVEASLRFNDANEEAQDSSGFGECLKDRTVDTTDDSLCIPETQPPSANASVNTTADSFFIPETQAIVFERPTVKGARVSLDDDLMIPETEGDPADPVNLNQETTTRGSDDTESSGMGSQIRICTQDFNDFNEDAIDDFDSSLMLGDPQMALGPSKAKKESPEKQDKKQGNQLDATDLDMSALNWSATNSKCTVFNSTKADETHRAASCITPDLSAPLADTNRDISTPDILELMEAHDEERAAHRSNATTPQLCGIKQLVVATIETPGTTQNEEDEDINQDFVATQAFPSRVSQAKESADRHNPDFIATQVFPGSSNISKIRQDADIDQDLVATQAFPSRLLQTKEFAKKINQDLIATQVFPSKDKILQSGNESLNQDFVETQAFPSRLPQPEESSGIANPDSIETQPFNFNKENIPQDSDSWCDDIEEILKEMTSGNVVSSPPSSPKEGTLQYVKPGVIKDKDHNRKVFLFENVFPNADNSRWKNELLVEEKGNLKRTASTDTPCVTPSKRNRRLSEHSERLDDACSSLSYSRKRPANSQEGDKSEPPTKSKCKVTSILETSELSTEDEAAASKVAVTKRPTRRAKYKSRSPTPKVETREVKKVTRTRTSRQAKIQEDKPKENPNPPKLIRTRRQTKCLEPEEVNTKPPEIMTKQKAAKTEPIKEEATKRGVKKLVENDKKNPEEAKEVAEKSTSKRSQKNLLESSKKNPEEAKEDADQSSSKGSQKKLLESSKKNPEEAEQSTSKGSRKKAIENAKKDLEEPKNPTKRRPGRPRKASSTEDIISKPAKLETSTREAARITNNSTAALPDKYKLIKHPVVLIKRAIVGEMPSTSKSAPSTSNSAPTEGEKTASKKPTSAPQTRLSQEHQQDPLKAINKYVRQAKSEGKIKIAFTMCNRLALNHVINALKKVIDVTEDPVQCDVLIMDKGERTFKFLTAIALNKPVFNSNWLESIKSTKTITVKDDHLFDDSNFKKTYKFDPLSVLQHSRLLNGFHFLLCEGIQPKVTEMMVIIQSAGGTVHSKPPPLASIMDLYVVTTSQDKQSKQRLRNYENVHYIKAEGVMASLVQHKVELLDEHKVKL